MPQLLATPAEVVDRARSARAAARRAAVDELEAALDWALLHPAPAGETPAHWGDVDLHGEAALVLAGDGAPLVAEFAPAELAAALGVSRETGQRLLADALDLAHRFPRLWGHVRAGEVAAWRARRVVEEARDLPRDGARHVDLVVSACVEQVEHVDVARLVQETRLFLDPDRARADEEAALSRRGVWLHPGRTPATTEVAMTLDTDEAHLFDQSVRRVAADLRALGDDDPLDVRRARAVGVLADPQLALDLMSGREHAPTSRSGDVALHVHVTPEHLEAGAVVEGLGAVTTTLLGEWLRRHTSAAGRVVVRPILDLAGAEAVDAHDPPARMRELVVMRDRHCVFPGCRRDARRCDLDHVTPYLSPDDGGPPGQTNPQNLAPLCRTHHRLKTHGSTDGPWSYERRPDGGYRWTAPTGHVHAVR